MVLHLNFLAETSQAETLKDPTVPASLSNAPIDTVAVVQAVNSEAHPDGSARPNVKALELYLIQATKTWTSDMDRSRW